MIARVQNEEKTSSQMKNMTPGVPFRKMKALMTHTAELVQKMSRKSQDDNREPGYTHKKARLNVRSPLPPATAM